MRGEEGRWVVEGRGEAGGGRGREGGRRRRRRRRLEERYGWG